MIKIGIIGPNKSVCGNDLYDFGENLGKVIAKKDRVFLNGGAGGFMEAVCKGVKSSKETFDGQTIGILQGDNAEEANEFIDIAIPTGMGIARNMILVNSSDIIIAAGGGAGTLSELAFAWQKKKIVLCVTEFGGWSKELAGKNLDHRLKDLLIPVKTIEAIENYIKQM
ncbi:hypothetical protein DFQ10_10799 [Winogradskyella eximia]|uniref:TIGR00725 family protein n=1 Tax=Winogradskyella eximia TaxID=262006 RepID=A0A3D9H082_9FLAO|nr:TIGR00725 family protein [Winogradskyella eximia]RED42914.1 hypothetical protein DFQ10_10799 [Winogradskyella eximia]